MPLQNAARQRRVAIDQIAGARLRSARGPHAVLDLLERVTTAVAEALDALEDWGPSGEREGQYRSDVVADEVARSMLSAAGLGVLSEESGLTNDQQPLLAVVDPLDGSTNASRGIPWYASSIAVMDEHGPLAARVVNLASGVTFEALRGGGATCNGLPIAPSGSSELASAIVAISAYPKNPIGAGQFRCLGAAALDLCAVACGMVDAFVDYGVDAHGVWDYLGGLLVCTEAGASISDAWGRDLVVRSTEVRRTPVAAAGGKLIEEVLAVRRADGDPATR